jgi:hypothetical protein
MMQKVMRIGIVVTHQAIERCPISLPVFSAQGTSGCFIHIQMRHQILRHGAIDVRKYMRAGVMQRVVKIENPDSLTM